MTRKLTTTERLFLKAIAPLSEWIEGYVVAFGEEVVRTHGLQGFMRWSQVTVNARSDLRKAFGNRIEHLLSCFASFWNGCGYCAHGNMLAHNLMLYRDEGKIFPIDEDDLIAMHEDTDDVVVEKLEALLADFPEEMRLIHRQFELKLGAEPQNEEDEHLWKSLRLYDFINECSIVVDPPAPAFDKVAKDRKLIQAYRQARSDTA